MATNYRSNYMSLLFSVLVLINMQVYYCSDSSLEAASTTFPMAGGGWSQIKYVKKDGHVQHVGKYAISEYNNRTSGMDGLAFMGVLEGQSQVVAGMNYKLLIEAQTKNMGVIKVYEALVWEKPWMDFINLTSFAPILPNMS